MRAGFPRTLHGPRALPSSRARSIAAVNEAHISEVERVLLYVSEARERAERARALLAKDGAEPHLVAALQESEERLRAEHSRLLQKTFYAVPGGQDKLAV